MSRMFCLILAAMCLVCFAALPADVQAAGRGSKVTRVTKVNRFGGFTQVTKVRR